MKIWCDRLYHLGITSAFAITGFGVGAIGFLSEALAQSNIVPDETLAENERSVVTPNFNGTPSEVITGGATRGRNLFHSFREFNVDAERGAYFFSPDGIANILSRVTGGNPSAINGILGTFGIDGDNFVRSGANLFLINPNGIIFGPEARLNLGGSFMATTADGIQFGEAGFFSATNPEAPSQLLTVDPSAFFFNQLSPPVPIINQSVVSINDPSFIDGLRVDDGRSLLLLGGEIQLFQGKLFASSGRVELGAVTGGTVGLTIDGSALDLTFPSSLQLGNIFLSDSAVDGSGIQSTSTVGGEIQLQGDQITLINSTIQSNNYSNQPNGTVSLQANQLSLTSSIIDMSGTQAFSSAGGAIQLQSDQTTLTNSTIQSNNYSNQPNGAISLQASLLDSTNSFIRTNTLASGTGGNINIVADTINLQDGNGSGISTSSQSQGRAGNIDIRATDTINLNNQVSIASSFNGLLPTTGSGSSGNISLTTENLNVQDAGIFSVVLLGGESSGTLTIRVDDSVNLNRANLFTSSLGNSSSGHISITTGDLRLANGSNILTSAIDPTLFDTANLDPRLYTPESIAFVRQRFAGVEPGSLGQGDSGNITVLARGNIRVTDGSTINTSTIGQGQGGNLNIMADSIELDGTIPNGQFSSGLFSSTQGTGNAGSVMVDTEQLRITGGAGISTSAFLNSSGQAGNITVTADSIELDGTTPNGRFNSGLFSSTQSTGDAGDVSVTTDQLRITNGATISTSAEANSRGQGGNLSVTSDLIELDGTTSSGQQLGSSLSSSTEGTGDAGNVVIDTDQLRITGGATISTGALLGSSGQGGDINITADSIELIGTAPNEQARRSNLASETLGSGNAGDVNIATRQLQITGGAAISTSTFSNTGGRAGDIDIAADSIELDGTIPSGLSSSGLFSSTQGTGDAGNISITTEQLQVTDRAAISTSTAISSTGQGGNITVNATDSIELSGSSADGQFASGLFSLTSGAGRAGNVTVDTRQLRASAGGTISTSALISSSGRGGNVDVTADSIELDGTTPNGLSGSGLSSSTQGTGNAGNVVVDAEQIRITNGAVISTSALIGSSGRGGNVDVTADSIELDGTTPNGQFSGGLSSFTQGSGDAGNVVVDTDQLRITGGATISTSALRGSSGQGGDIDITADSIELIGTTPNQQSGSSLSSETLGIGDAGDVSIATEQLRIRGGALISTRSFGSGRGGNLIVNATDSIELSGTSANGQLSSGLFSLTTGAGRAGNLRVETGDLRIQDGAQISASTLGIGRGGNVRVIADTIDLSGTSANRLLLSSISSETYSLAENAGDAGRINISARELRVRDRAGVSTSTFGQGNAGNITAQVLDRIALSNTGFISSSVAAGAVGDSGSITLRTGSLSATRGSQIAALVSRERRDQQGNRIAGGRGRGGSINITASDSIRLSGTNSDGSSSGILTLSERGASGPAGDITLRTSNFRIANGAIVVASTFNDGEGGSIAINADNFEATEGGQVVTSTRGTGNAGEITLNVMGDVSLSGRDRNFQNRRDRTRRYTNRPGQSDRVSDVVVSQGANSGLFANTENVSGGRGGSIALNAANLSLTNRATISAQSQGTGNAGNIDLNLTESVNATNSNIITSTSSQNASGGDITLSASNVHLFGDSDIRTDVQGQGGGGNIAVAADYVVAFDDSDILAYSVSGVGGNIVLPAFFGENYFDENDRPENESPSRAELNELDGNSQVNVDASGQVSSGTITTPDTSFIQNSLTDLPESAIDTDALLANSCISRSETDGTFIITGAEGLPQRPGDAVMPTYPTGTVRSVPDEESDATSNRPWQMGDSIVEPQGAYQMADGRWVLSRECSSR